MRRSISTTEIHWVDITDPDDADLRYLTDELAIHPVDAEESRRPSSRPRVEVHPGYVFFVIHVPAHVHEEGVTVSLEFDLFVTTSTLVTVHESSVRHLEKLYQEASAGDGAKERVVGRGVAYLLYRILDHLFEVSLPMLDHVAERLARAETKIFSGHERDMVTELSLIQRDLQGFRGILRPQRHLYEPGTLQDTWGTPTLQVVFRSAHAKLRRVWEHLETLWERTEALTDTNAALLNHKLNEFVKTLTIISALFIPLGLVAQTAVFLHAGIPLFNRLSFWLLITLMFLIDFVTLWKARYRQIL